MLVAWAARVTRWTDSGLTAAECGLEIGVNPRSLTWWKWQLASESRSPGSPKRTVARHSARTVTKATTTTISPLTFVEMTGRMESEPTGRKPLPEHLPRVEILVLPPEVERKGLDAFERIGEDVCETVERRPASLVVARVVRPKFVAPFQLRWRQP